MRHPSDDGSRGPLFVSMYAASLAPSGCTARFAVYLLLQAETIPRHSVRSGQNTMAHPGI